MEEPGVKNRRQLAKAKTDIGNKSIFTGFDQSYPDCSIQEVDIRSLLLVNALKAFKSISLEADRRWLMGRGPAGLGKRAACSFVFDFDRLELVSLPITIIPMAAYLFWNQICRVLTFTSGPSCLANISLVVPSGLLNRDQLGWTLIFTRKTTYGFFS